MKTNRLRDKIAQGINDLFYIWKQEFKTTFRDQGVLIFFILVPLAYPLVYSFIYNNEVVREVPAVAVDCSHSSTRWCARCPPWPWTARTRRLAGNTCGKWMPRPTYISWPTAPT